MDVGGDCWEVVRERRREDEFDGCVGVSDGGKSCG